MGVVSGVAWGHVGGEVPVWGVRWGVVWMWVEVVGFLCRLGVRERIGGTGREGGGE